MWDGAIRRSVREDFMPTNCGIVTSIVYLGMAGVFGLMQPAAPAAEDRAVVMVMTVPGCLAFDLFSETKYKK